MSFLPAPIFLKPLQTKILNFKILKEIINTILWYPDSKLLQILFGFFIIYSIFLQLVFLYRKLSAQLNLTYRNSENYK